MAIEQQLSDAGMAFIRTGSFFTLRPRSSTTDVDYVVLDVPSMQGFSCRGVDGFEDDSYFNIAGYVKRSNAFFESIGCTMTSSNRYAGVIACEHIFGGPRIGLHLLPKLSGHQQAVFDEGDNYLGKAGSIITYRIGRVNIILTTGINDFMAWGEASDETYCRQISDKVERVNLHKAFRINPKKEIIMYESKAKLFKDDPSAMRGFFLRERDFEDLEWAM